MINLYDFLDAATGQLFGEPKARAFGDFCADVRRLQPGQLFVAIPSERGDGHRFIQEAVAAGAGGVICTNPPPGVDLSGVTCVVVHDVQESLTQWARYVLRKYGTTVIGLAGAHAAIAHEAVAQVLGARYRVFKGPHGCRGCLRLPLALGSLEPDHQLAVLTLVGDHVGDLAEMVSLVQPVVAVVTGIPEGEEHLAGEYRALIEGLPKEGLAVLNYDEAAVRSLAAASPAPVMTFGLDTSGVAYGADLMAYNIQQLRYRTAFDLRHGARRHVGRWVQLLGAHQLYGALAALVVGLAYRVPLDDATQALTDLEPLPGRLRPLEGAGGCTLIDDTHEVTVEATLRALDWLRQVREPEGRLIFVMGGIESAGWARQNLRLLGKRVAETADLMVAQGHMASQVGRAAVELGMEPGRVRVTFNPSDTAAQLRTELGPQDVVLVKGAASAQMDQVVRGLLRDPVRDAARAALHVTEEQPVAESAGLAWAASWVEVDLDAIAHNVRFFKKQVNQDRAGAEVALMVVVRANAYGHGAVEVSATAALNGADYLGVGSLEEAVRLREGGVDAPILVLGYTPGWMARQAILHGVSVTLFDEETAHAFDRVARDLNATVRVHVKVDTGMGRLGLLPESVPRFFRVVTEMDRLTLEGLYTQLGATDTLDPTRTHEQLRVFRVVLSQLAGADIRFCYVHAANTAAALTVSESIFSMVRAGIGVYGLSPSDEVPLPVWMRPAMAWKTHVVQVKALPPGSLVGFGNAWRAQDRTTVAVIPVGYADGLRRGPRQWKYALVRGQRAPLIGQVGMDLTTLDVTAIPDVHLGDEVVLLGRQGGEAITVGDAAHWLDTSRYDVLTGILAHAPRGRLRAADRG